MKLRYMIDSIMADRQATVPEYVPVGVWVQGPGPGLDVEMYYLDRGPNGLADRKDEAAWVVNRLVEAGAKGIIEYDSRDLGMVKGLHSNEIEKTLGYCRHGNVIRGENLALLKEKS